jgi:Mg2+ and Co2+ transporter CorA
MRNNINKQSKFNPNVELPLSATSSNFLNLRTKKFATDGLLFYLINITLEKLKKFSQELFEDAKTLKEIYLEISEKERKDFYRRLECTEIFIVLIRNETFSKRNFIEFVKSNYFSEKGEQTNFFGNSSVFLLELLIAKTKQIEIKFNQIKFYTNMVKENYNIILEDNSKKNKDRLNQIIKIISLTSVFFMPFNIISGLFGMNIKIPFVEWENLVPFSILLALKIAIFFVHIYIFKKYKFI